ncbi:HDOD domain-containing protein [Sediminispirochaeta bajacaliforniensis]|uniref:HDOD domain-containing protein n=1 Tax=Sediminispirochaeta bajacaliforniensis TaxID=148 RepID=UPI00036A7FEB|nr:HDOD domain-containing protein [Sediminispirochaeta bajacaliforniensis]
MSEDREKNLRIVALYINKMPSLPTSVAKVMEISNDPNASPADLNRVISIDPVLMGRVMKLINSAYYGLNQRITSLVRAIIMLGINTVKNLALSTAILGNLGGKEHFQALNMDGFWRHSLCVGVTAKQIAKKRKVDPRKIEEFFVAGLLHDIGKIPLNNRLSDQYFLAMSTADRETMPLYKAEKRAMAIHHCEAGQLIAKTWNLGQEISDAIIYHHTPSAYEGKHREMVLTIAAANYLANFLEIGFSGDRYPEKLALELFDEIGVSFDWLEEIEEVVNEEIERARIFLKLGGEA